VRRSNPPQEALYPGGLAAARSRSAAPDELKVALLIPRSGSAGLFGPSCELSARLAAEELNKADGAGGRQVRLVPVDAGASPREVATETDRLISAGAVDAVVGWQTSAVRQALTSTIQCRVPYVYTAQYEGGERSPGVFLTGETPARQLLPAMCLLGGDRGIRRWCVVGNDYVWPRVTAAAARRYARQCGARVTDELFVPLGTTDFSAVLSAVERGRADAVLMLLVGNDAAQFNRAFAAASLDARALRLSTLMDENMLLASGPDATRDLWAASGYFETLATSQALSFSARYASRFGVHAPPVGGPGESCYEGIRLLAALCQGQSAFEGARGALSIRGNHVDQPVYLAEADCLDFHVRAQLLSGVTRRGRSRGRAPAAHQGIAERGPAAARTRSG
jgi:ABC-type branched-subunit amino acid transport system substrate-binding protein